MPCGNFCLHTGRPLTPSATWRKILCHASLKREITEPTSHWGGPFLLWVISSHARGTHVLSSLRFRNRLLMLITKAISSECRRKEKDHLINGEEQFRRFPRVIARYTHTEIRRSPSRDRRWLIENDSIRLYTIWFCTITRMNRRNLTSLCERARPLPRARRYTYAYWRGIFPVKSINPVEFSIAASRIRARFVVVVIGLCSSTVPFTTPSIPASQAGKENT